MRVGSRAPGARGTSPQAEMINGRKRSSTHPGLGGVWPCRPHGRAVHARFRSQACGRRGNLGGFWPSCLIGQNVAAILSRRTFSDFVLVRINLTDRTRIHGLIPLARRATGVRLDGPASPCRGRVDPDGRDAGGTSRPAGEVERKSRGRRSEFLMGQWLATSGNRVGRLDERLGAESRVR